MKRIFVFAIVAVLMSLAGAQDLSGAGLQGFTADSRVKAMMDEVDQTTVTLYVATLSGETSATIGGSPYRITTRATGSGTPIEKATQYAYEHMARNGLAASYHEWGGGRNVVGEIAGKTKAKEIVVVTAHLDDSPTSGVAPGADDDGSGASALMAAATICAKREFQRTVRFVLFTGEEQGNLGGEKYAQEVHDLGDNIVAVVNMDMIGYNKGTAVVEVHTRSSTRDGYGADLRIATVMTNVILNYGLSSSLTPALRNSGEYYTAVDSFRKWGYPGVLLIEQNTDFNPYYHTVKDTLANLDARYLRDVTKTVVGMVGHLGMLTAPKNAAGWSAYLYR